MTVEKTMESIANGKDLKQIAMEARTVEKLPTSNHNLGKETIKRIALEIAQCIIATAKEGKLQLEYSFGDYDVKEWDSVSGELQKLYPTGVIIIKNYAQNSIHIDWSGKNVV